MHFLIFMPCWRQSHDLLQKKERRLVPALF